MPTVSISPIDALWTLYQSQNKQVRKAFRSRVLAEEASDQKKAEMQAYERTLPPEVRHAARAMTDAIKQSAEEARMAAVNHTHVGRNADDFLTELEQETE